MNAISIIQPTVECTGFVIRTETFDRYGVLRGIQHGKIHRTREAAEASASQPVSKGFCLPTDRVVRTVVEVSTALPAEQVEWMEAVE